MSAHAALGPSGASTWMNCPGSVNAQAGLPDDASEFAAEGTMMHEVSDLCLRFGFGPFDFVGCVFEVDGYTFEFDDDHAEALLPGIDRLLKQGGQFFGEHRVDLSHWLGEDQFGTLDRGSILPAWIEIEDFKGGRGVPVSPVRNKQLMLYALGFWWNVARHLTDVTEFRLRIDQPRCAGGGGEWRTTLDELLAFGEEARAASERARDPNAPRIASAEACQWCSAKRLENGGCGAFEAFNLEILGMQFEDLDAETPPALPQALTPERRAYLIQHSGMISAWLAAHHDQALQDALAGLPAGGLKAVAGRRSPSKWADKAAAEAVVEQALGEFGFTKKLITPTQAGKLMPPAEFEKILKPHVQYGEKKPILVPEADARPALLAADQFEDLEQSRP